MSSPDAAAGPRVKCACAECDKTFKTREAAEQHLRDAHRYSCGQCRKAFKSERSLEQHSSMAHPAPSCPECDKTFKTRQAADQHLRDAHPASSDEDSGSLLLDIDPSDIDAPVSEPGEWVAREDFPGRKSFGYFVCDARCTPFWMSAHAFPDYTQDCRHCDRSCLPLFLWHNVAKPDNKNKKPVSAMDPTKPHLSHLCGACEAGVCDGGRGSFAF